MPRTIDASVRASSFQVASRRSFFGGAYIPHSGGPDEGEVETAPLLRDERAAPSPAEQPKPSKNRRRWVALAVFACCCLVVIVVTIVCLTIPGAVSPPTPAPTTPSICLQDCPVNENETLVSACSEQGLCSQPITCVLLGSNDTVGCASTCPAEPDNSSCACEDACGCVVQTALDELSFRQCTAVPIATPPPAPPPTEAPLPETSGEPLIEIAVLCNHVFTDENRTGTCRVHFSYVNTAGEPLTVPVGANKYMDPGPLSDAHTTVFGAGQWIGAVHSDWDCTTYSSNSWIVRSGAGVSVATTTRAHRACPSLDDI